MGVKSYFSRVYNAVIDKRSHFQSGGTYYSGFSSGQNDSNEFVSVDRGSKISTVFTCINTICQDIAKLPFNVLKDSENGKAVQKMNPVYRVIHTQPNENTSAFNFWYSIMWGALTKGNGIAIIIRDAMQNVTQLVQVDYDHVNVIMEGGSIFYSIDGMGTFPATEIFHIKMYTLNGSMTGFSPIMWNANVMGYKIKQEKYSAKAIGTKGTGFITSEGLVAEQGQKVAEQMRSQIEAGKIPFLGTKGKTDWHNQMITPNEAQYIETKMQTNQEIYGIFRLPPTFAQNYTETPYGNAEQQDLVYVKQTLTPWIRLIEQECDIKLFREVNKNKRFPLFTKFNLNGILRGDIKTRFEMYDKAMFGGMMNADEARDLEDMPPQANGVGKIYYVQSAMIEKGTTTEEPTPPAERSINGHDKEIEKLLQ